MRTTILLVALLATACTQPVDSVSSNLCQLDPRTGRCKVSEDTLLSRAASAVDEYAYQNYDAAPGGVSCSEGTGPGGNGSDPGTFWCTKQFGDTTLYCGGSFTDGGIPDDLSCFTY